VTDAFTEPPRWGEPCKPREQLPARIVSIRPAYAGAVGAAGQAAVCIVTVETENSILECFIDERSAGLLLAVADCLPGPSL
jgi:hypothetical protein